MNKLGFIVTIILLPFLYSIGCEHVLLDENSALGSFDLYMGWKGQVYNQYHTWLNAYNDYAKAFASKYGSYEAAGQKFLNMHPDYTVFPGTEGANALVLFNGLSSGLLMGILLPAVLLSIDNAPAIQPESFVFNKSRSDYKDNHFIVAEGKIELKGGELVLTNYKICREKTYDGKLGVVTNWNGSYYVMEHTPNSDLVKATPLTRTQVRELERRIAKANKETYTEAS